MSDLNQVKKDFDAAHTFTRIIENETGRTCTKSLRRYLERAFMAGVAHERKNSAPNFGDLFGGML